MNAIRAVANSIVIADRLHAFVGFFETNQELLEFVDTPTYLRVLWYKFGFPSLP